MDQLTRRRLLLKIEVYHKNSAFLRAAGQASHEITDMGIYSRQDIAVSLTVPFCVIAAEGEQRASRSLKEAAEVIADTPSALQLRYLQTLASIAAEKNSTIVFPIPMELFSGFINSASSHAGGGHGGGGDVKKDLEASA
ncbi:hypothetical protein HPB48_001461 [Haemaphysalis longicornis]|uniref:Uncharacterized protein n=1 Tax=Haemaphysalis longicornis TaxID=44386 RepID=A0A9J6FGQ7_HAELO|nr:hypothetical protein HPB48_001461 [Haemaphysalis longicornis]